mmetsp:Transcript_74058/g.216980  ORF Transcript_74058/g.216980 Transcript_74058/m.216980 type:complete len:173 (-) Transcript_74058:73-591(-)
MRASAGTVLALACLAAAARLSTAESIKCNCGCCLSTQRGSDLAWSEKHKPGDSACVPTFFGTPFKNEGFAECEHVLGVYGSFCMKETQDRITAEVVTQEVDVVQFCFYECMPSAVGVPNGECTPKPIQNAFEARGPVPPPLASALQLSSEEHGLKGQQPLLRQAARHTPSSV